MIVALVVSASALLCVMPLGVWASDPESLDEWLDAPGSSEMASIAAPFPEATFVLEFECLKTDADTCERLQGQTVMVNGVSLTLSVVTPTATSTPVSSTPTQTPTPASTPTPTPVSKEYVEPEFVTTAERVLRDVDLQVEIYGRELDGDELAYIYYGLIHWHTVDFFRRCMIDDPIGAEYPQATERIELRFSDAEFIKDRSYSHFAISSVLHPRDYFDMKKTRRYVESIYFDPVEDTHVRAESIVDYRSCEPNDIERIKMGKQPSWKYDTPYTGISDRYKPLESHEIGQPVAITTRRLR